MIQTTSYNFTGTAPIPELCAGVVKAFKVPSIAFGLLKHAAREART